jgi:hypothetical protein
MFAFILEIAIFACLAGILALALRALPRISNEVFTGSHSFIKTHELTLFVERLDESLKAVFEKFLRRIKVIILKLDNIVTKKITKFQNDRSKERISYGMEAPALEAPEVPPAPTYDFVKSVPVEETAPAEEKPKKRGRKKVAL